ncbi:MAG: transglutaminase domain-containing protein [Lachnospiraceae bacterium]
MFSKEVVEWIEIGYAQTQQFLISQGALESAREMETCLQNCDEDEKIVMKYYFSAMPYSDFSDVSFDLLRKYARHALFLRREIPWCREVSEKTFLMDVAAYRINNEKIVDCRELFFAEVWERIKNLTVQEAVLEINYWCAEHATYHLADPRTSSALTVYRSGFGRCGEESVFTVTVLRSVGIPARQVYTPLWAHCDSNHAWVEVWCEGNWYFLGACEPEEILNKGWFTMPASRAMLLHAKYFTCLPMEEAEFTEGFVHYVNRLSDYAHSTLLTVNVVDTEGQPVSDATVHFEVLNSAHFGGIATKETDAEGRVQIEVGKGSLRLHVVKGKQWICQNIMSTQGTVKVVLDDSKHFDGRLGEWQEYTLIAPDCERIHAEYVTRKQQKRNKERIARAEQIRLARNASYYQEEKGKRYPEIEQRLRECGANFEELMIFLERDENPYRPKLLAALSFKDMYDVTAAVLEEHLQAAMPFADCYPEEIFVRFLMNPRVEHEELVPYRQFLGDYFTKEQKEEFITNPREILKYIRTHLHYEERKDFERLRVSPQGALKMRMADPVSQQILFCDICRTLGIPARFRFMDRSVEYYQNGKFHSAESIMGGAENNQSIQNTQDRQEVMIELEPNTEWSYFHNWTLSVLENGMFHPLGLFREAIENHQMKLSLKKGIYNIITSVRMANGNQLVRECFFEVKAGEQQTIFVKKHVPKLEEQLIDREVFCLAEELDMPNLEEGEGKRQMVLWLEPGKEPTQHVLNELLERKEQCAAIAAQIVLVLQDENAKKESLLQRVLAQISGITCVVSSRWELSEKVAESLNLQAGQYPLVYVKREDKHIIYADCGYNAGSVALMLMLMGNNSFVSL